MLAVITFIAYANAWPDTLTLDDRVFVNPARFAGLGPADIAGFFTEDLWAASGVDSNLYRPLLLVSLALQTRLFGNWLAGYHLFSIVLHVLVTLLVYRFAAQVLCAGGVRMEAARRAAFLAALVFGVHPIHAEVVNSAFNGSELLVSIGVVGGLHWFLRTLDAAPYRAWLGLSVIYLLVLLCRESGASLPALAVAAICLTRSQPWLVRLRQCLPVLLLLVPLVIYLALRGQALDPAGTATHLSISEQPAAPSEPAAPAAESTAPQRATGADSARSPTGGVRFRPQQLGPAVILWFESLKIMLWPHPLQIHYEPPATSVWLALAVHLTLLAMALWAYLKKRPAMMTGLAFFYLALLPSSQMFGDTSAAPGLADRILYLPSVGMAIVLAVAFAAVADRWRTRASVAGAVAAGIIFTALTWARNAEWASDTALFESDYSKLGDKRIILNSLLAAHLREGNSGRVLELCDTHSDFFDGRASWGVHCGFAYSRAGRFADAETAYLAASRHQDSTVFAHANLAVMYAHLGRTSEALDQFERALAAERSAFLKEYIRGLMLVQLHPNDRARLLEARVHLQRALQLQPQHAESRAELDQLEAKLGITGNRDPD